MTFEASNSIIEDIVRQVEQLSKEDQKILLARLRLQKLLSEKRKKVVRAKGVKPLSMKEIDRIKHASRKKRDAVR